MFFHDILANFVKDGETVDLFSAEVTFKDRADADAFSNVPEKGKMELAQIEWLRHRISTEVIPKQVLVALLADFCHFVFEALNGIKKGKLTVVIRSCGNRSRSICFTF